MFKIGVREYSLVVHRGPLPGMYGEYRKHAAFADEFDLDSSEGKACFVVVGNANTWPFLVVGQRFSPSKAGFDPGVLLVPESKVLFVGAGTRLLAYSLDGPSRLWEDTADPGFWCWSQHGDFVLMSAELELAAWDIQGRKLWTTPVEPPWNYRVEGGRVEVEIVDKKLMGFPIGSGPLATMM